MSLRVYGTPAEWAQASPGRASVLTVGIFDGLHLGHQQILSRVVVRAREASPPAVAGAITFDPHPTRVLRPEQAPPLIATLEQRLEGFAGLGLEAALVLTFDRALSQLSPEEFVRSILVERLRACAVLVGENFRFGHKQAGTVQLLQEVGARFGFVVEVVPPVKVNGGIVSSTGIRQAVQAGEVDRATRFMGQPFSLTGAIARGSGQGHKILVPTLNLNHEQELLPAYGVYVTECDLEGRSFRSVTNVGVRPTLDGSRLVVESHLLDFSREVTAGRLRIRFLKRLRDEQKFNSLDALREQIHRDITAAREYFSAPQAR